MSDIFSEGSYSDCYSCSWFMTCNMIANSVVCFVVIITTLCNSGPTSASGWNYHNSENWPSLCNQGKHQSPIDLSPEAAEETEFEPFIFHGYRDPYYATIKNNGHTVELRLDSSSLTPNVSGGGLNSVYNLDSWHFHWESEHTIDNIRYPLEVHMVHYDSRYKDLATALEHNGVAVLGVFFYLSPDDLSELVPMFRAIENIIRDNNKLNSPQKIPDRVELNDFLPRDRAGFYRYNGSLTTPSCAEGVTWTVFFNGLPISRQQHVIFSKLRSDGDKTLDFNYRSLQEINDRHVYIKRSSMEIPQGHADSASFTPTPNALKIFILFIISVNLL